MKKIIKSIFSVWPFYDLVCWQGRRSSGKVALTFDDGPRRDSTEQVLDILRLENISATFFLEGRWVEKNPELVDDIISDGHEIGNHGYDHGDAGVLVQLEKGAAALREAGVTTKLFRPALGRISFIELVQIRMKGFRTVLWSFDAHDSMRDEGKWIGTTPDYSAIKAGDIILLHDDNNVCINELPELISAAKDNNLTFVKVSDIY